MASKINHPSHYGGDTIHEHIKVMESWLTFEQFVGYCRGNATKYLCRAEKKSSVEENLEKAIFYINYEIGFRRRRSRMNEIEEFLNSDDSHLEVGVKSDDYDPECEPGADPHGP